IQEETHRFAITFHHERHTKSTLHSALEEIPGIGEVRRQTLLKKFKSLKAIREAKLEELQDVLGRAAGEKVYSHFHKEEP
ncbi:MAG: excinuclease ABC subunit UvrC, partial [Oscillospiraceae bacterium]|nr:excinuclease ABC subunit UvrC [Oscillospiraceae bacterium]